MNKERKTGRGQLNYEASFFPTLALAKEAAKKEEEEEAEAKEVKEVDATKPEVKDVTEETPVKPATPAGPPAVDLHGVPIIYTEDKSRINLLAYGSGVLSVKIHEVMLPNKARAVAEVLLDSNDAQFRTGDVKGTVLAFQESGDAFVKEMDFSRLVVRVREAKNDNESERIGFWTSRVQDIVKTIQNRADVKAEADEIQEFRLLDCAGGVIRLSFKFIPVVQFKLDPSDSLESKSSKLR